MILWLAKCKLSLNKNEKPRIIRLCVYIEYTNNHFNNYMFSLSLVYHNSIGKIDGITAHVIPVKKLC